MTIYWRKILADLKNALGLSLVMVVAVALLPVGFIIWGFHPLLDRYTDLEIGIVPLEAVPLGCAVVAIGLADRARLSPYHTEDDGQ